MIKRKLPILILVIGLIIFYSSDITNYVSMENFSKHYKTILLWSNNHVVYSILIFVITYIAVVSFSIPIATILTLVGGFLYGVYLGTILVVVSATIGGVITFISFRYSFNNNSNKKISEGQINNFQKGFRKNAVSYLLFLRLVPLFPFFLVNIACGLIKIKTKDFILGTFFGIIPGTFVYVWVGSGIGFTFMKGSDINYKIIFEPQILFPLLALSILALIPIVYKKIKASK